ncbi:hypothetical protein [Mycolicibacterium nivoides]|uniref:Uncharacterized protein n=2 Tax=Mycolicibacterium nivoides TaxID=2487344 RepID=A0ABW9L265_9MYCO|nr:hypothetical protein SAMN04488583_1986 [Mycobacterium sp. 88mf]SFF39921.1 hypothetical protein SAMN04488582_102323 [Mycobacterium sp. 455mf]
MSPQSGMSAQLSEVRGGGDALAVPFARPRIRPEKALQYELNVVADDVADVVSDIGGWLFDRAMAGWRVSVAADEVGDERALGILGLKAVGPSGLWRSAEADAVVMTAIGTSCFEPGDHGLTMRNPGGDVVFFGSRGPDGLGLQIQRARYRPSAAALAFKAHALAVAGADPASVDQVETLFRCGRSAGLLDADLVPVC